jgi:N-acetylglucosamine-6-phosphate deacetylase
LDCIAAAQQVLGAGAPHGYRGAQPLGLHVEGPFLNPKKKGAHNPQYLRPPDLEAVKDWSPQSEVRLVTLAPELPGAGEVIVQLKERGVVVSAGHSMLGYEQAQAAFQLGVRCGTHLFNAMPPLNHRAPGLAGALLGDPDVNAGIIVDGLHVHSAMVALAWQLKGGRGLFLVTDAMAAAGMPPGDYELGHLNVHVDGHTARLDDGTLAGSLLSMDTALRNLVAFTGCSLTDALPALTRIPADLLGMPQKGRLFAGCAADLVLLSADLQVQGTILAGELVYSPF